jgi:carbamoyl-phosphate synthase large subunit
MKIAISGLNNNDNPAPGVGVAKSLKNKHSLIGLSYDVNETGVYQDIFESSYLMPFPTMGWEEIKNRILEIKEREKIEAIIPTLDAELPVYIKYQNELKNMGIKTLLPSIENFEIREKSKLPEFSSILGVKHPPTIKVFSVEELISAIKEIGYPCMIKGNYYKAYKAENLEEAIEHFYSISNEWGFPIIVQKIVSGIEINYIGLSNKTLIGGVGIKKMSVTSLGKIWSAISIKNSALLDLAKRFVEITKWKGAFEIEAITDGKEIYLIEINPRFPAWVYFSTQLGINLPEMMIEILNGKDVEAKLEYPENKMYMRYVEELVTDFSSFSNFLSKKEIKLT